MPSLKTLIALLAAAALALSFACGPDNQAQDRDKKAEKEKAEAVPVEVANPFLASMESTLNLTATVFSENQVPVYSETTGIVEAPPLEEGTQVRRGQVLARLKRQELDLSLQMAQSTLDKAQADFSRSEELYRGRLISQDTFDQVRYALDQARIARDQARVNLEKATISAPIDGVVAQRLVRMGDLVKPQQQLFTLVDMATVKANLFVPEKNVASVRPGADVRVRSDAFPDRPFAGSVERVAPVADPATGTFKVTVALENPSLLLRPGMFLSASVVLDTHRNALVVPKKCLVYEGESPMVFLVRQDKAHKTAVTPGLSDPMNVEILKGLGPGDRVVTIGQSGLKEGSPVKVLPSAGGGNASMALGF
ncbi:MAG: efflux RND transporter periplasmic adaptor subunit [Acidobacteriota bacterium]